MCTTNEHKLNTSEPRTQSEERGSLSMAVKENPSSAPVVLNNRSSVAMSQGGHSRGRYTLSRPLPQKKNETEQTTIKM